jgi:NADPH-dependent curcumin reductase CurA
VSHRWPSAITSHPWAGPAESCASLSLRGALTYDETIVDGFDDAPRAYLDMLAGVGLGKRLLRIAVPDVPPAETECG